MQELKSIVALTQALKVVPGIGNKSAERIAYEFLKMDDEKVKNLITALTNLKSDVKTCPVCGSYMEGDKCEICSDETRDQDTIVVVSSYKDVLAFERLHTYHGLYHVLNGSISPTRGITASDINLASLFTRIEQGNIREIILATNPTIEGETTALYISRLLEKNTSLKLTRLAYGLPMGASLDYTDELTLTRALEGRTNLKK